MKRSLRSSGRGGFTLIETLTAMMILAISLVTIFQLFSGGLNSARRADGYTRAILFAREKMDEILLRDAFSEGELTGESGEGYFWRAEFRAAEPRGGVSGRAELFEVTVEITWGPSRRPHRFRIETLHLAVPVAVDHAA